MLFAHYGYPDNAKVNSDYEINDINELLSIVYLENPQGVLLTP